jgi:hypothetical protein
MNKFHCCSHVLNNWVQFLMENEPKNQKNLSQITQYCNSMRLIFNGSIEVGQIIHLKLKNQVRKTP